MTNPIPCSVLVMVRNAADSIGPCLESVRAFEHVIVLDGFSTDGTREIAAGFPNVEIVDQDPAHADADGKIVDFGAMRNVGLRVATLPWFLYVDADEVVTPALVASIRTATASSDADAYEVFRRFVVDGRLVRRSSQYPAVHVRLARRGVIESFVKPIHERLRLAPGARVRRLDGDLLIPLPPADRLRPKYRRYLELEARRAAALSVAGWLRWIFVWNIRSFSSYAVRLLGVWVTPGGGRLPLAYELQFLAYPLRLIARTVPFRRSGGRRSV